MAIWFPLVAMPRAIIIIIIIIIILIVDLRRLRATVSYYECFLLCESFQRRCEVQTCSIGSKTIDL